MDGFAWGTATRYKNDWEIKAWDFNINSILRITEKTINLIIFKKELDYHDF